MKKTLLVMRQEIITTVARRSFLFTAFGIPLISALIMVAVSALNQKDPGALSNIFGAEAPQQNQARAEGYIDQSGLVRAVPTSVPEGALQVFSDEASAQRALEAGQISAYSIISKDYIRTGKITYVRTDFNPFADTGQSGRIEWLLQVNLLGGNLEKEAIVQQPLKLSTETRASTTAQTRDSNNPMTFILPYAVTFIYYIVILMSSSLLLNSITKEKENRVIEVLMSTITPRQLLGGKIMGLGVVGLIQTVLWVGTSYTLLRLTGRSLSIPAAFQLPPSFLVWGLIFFVLGYAVYASLMAAVGALVPNLREASQATFVIILPMLIPMMMISILIEEPNGPLATALSLFPLTAPVAIMTRLAATEVPLWQVLLSASLLVLTAALIVRTVAGMFRAQTLLSGQTFTLKLLFAALSQGVRS